MSKLPHQRALQECLPYLLDNIRAPDLFDHLYAGHALTEEDMEDILHQGGPIKMTRKMILILAGQREEKKFQTFLKALLQTSSEHVIKKLEEKIEEIKLVDSQEGKHYAIPVVCIVRV